MLSTLQRTISRRAIVALTEQTRNLSFRPLRRGSDNYRPIQPRDIKKGRTRLPEDHFEYPDKNLIEIGEYESDDPLERNYGPLAADVIKLYQQDKKELEIEDQLRFADFITSEHGTTENLILERKTLNMSVWEGEDRESFEKEVDKFIEKERIHMMGLDNLDPEEDKELNEDGTEKLNLREEMDKENMEEQSFDERGHLIDNDPTILAHGDWSEVLVRVDRVQKVQRGGTLLRYRALVIGGNTKGVAGFGVAKGLDANTVSLLASKMSKRNIFFIERHLGNGLTKDLVGRHNSCKVFLRATSPGRGLHGHSLVLEILKRIGISDCSVKTHGNRNQFNVVRATFKAIMTHESLQDMARKRGRRLVNLERSKHFQV